MTTHYADDYSSATYTGGMLLTCECCGSRAQVCRCYRTPRACPGCDAYDADLAAAIARADLLPEPGPQGDAA
jgi:hypothetical protein